ncbi:TfpX/TfpZ family type IV pilin accessory protein [Noviherbaspirillum agri]
MIHWKQRFNAAAIHLLASLLIGISAATLVFAVWYPYPYSEVSGGRELFKLLVVVDVILGPLITFAIFNKTKPLKELRRDLSIVVLLQLAALCYGLWTVFVARPVYLVFELDRFRVVHAVDVSEELLHKAPVGLTTLPMFGHGLLAVRPFTSAAESAEATIAALQGVDLGTRPDLWQPYPEAASRVRRSAKPGTELIARFPDHAKTIDEALKKTGRSIDNLLSMPLVSRKFFWTVLLDAQTLEVVGFVPLDSF